MTSEPLDRAAEKTEPSLPKADSPLRETLRMFARNHAAMAALFVLIVIVLGTLIGPTLYGTDPFELVWAPFSPPGEDGFLLGTDYLGRDITAAILSGGRVSLAVGCTAALLSVFIGITVGALAEHQYQLGAVS